jgi:Fic family protein
VEVADFKDSPVGQLVPIRVLDRSGVEVDHVAFAPSPLPHDLQLAPLTYKVLTEAALALGRLDQAPARLPAHQYLIRLAVRREAVSTSALEGTFTRFTDVFESDYLDERVLSNSQREVRNYVRAAEWTYRQLECRKLDFALLCEAQALLLRGVPNQTHQSGRLRSEQAFIGSPERSVREARFIPVPPGERLADGIQAWEKWIHEEDDLPLIVRVALAHYQFEALHPFADGNGRLGRLAAILQLLEAGAIGLPLLSLSPWLEARKAAYQSHLLDVSRTGSFDPWICFFAEAVRDQAAAALERIDQIVDRGSMISSYLRKKGVRGLALSIAESLVGYPVISIRAAADLHKVTFQGASRAISRLVEEGVLAEVTGRRSDRLFVCHEIHDVVAG